MVKKKKKKHHDTLFQVVLWIIYGVFALTCFYPFYYVVINSISNNIKAQVGVVTLFPVDVHFKNYEYVFTMAEIWRAALVSLARSVIGTVLSVFCTTYAGYLFTKREIPGYKFWYRYVIVTMYFGAGLIPYFMTIRMLGLFNTFWVYIIPGLISTYNMILVKTYIESISPSLEESAMMDGAGYMRRFISIVFPLCKPIVATIALFSMVGQWNSFMDTVLYITDYKLHTLQYVLYQMVNNVASIASKLNELGGVDVAEAMKANTLTIRYATTVVVILPIMCVYPFIQKYYVKGVMLGAVKG